jgi:hypothetical protein
MCERHCCSNSNSESAIQPSPEPPYGRIEKDALYLGEMLNREGVSVVYLVKKAKNHLRAPKVKTGGIKLGILHDSHRQGANAQ